MAFLRSAPMEAIILLLQAGCPHRRFRLEALAPTTSPKSSHRNYGYRSRRRMQSPIAVQAMQHDRYQSRLCNQFPGSNLVKGLVKILKRGEKFIFHSGCLAVVASIENHNAEAESKKSLDLVLESIDRSGRSPKTVQNHVRVDSVVRNMQDPLFMLRRLQVWFRSRGC